jgi:hypothetical protein
VGNLLTIVLVFLSDITFGQGIDVITPWNLAGSGGIVIAFGILVYDMVQTHDLTRAAHFPSDGTIVTDTRLFVRSTSGIEWAPSEGIGWIYIFEE